MSYLGNSEFDAWQQIPEENIRLPEEVDETDVRFIPSQLRFEQSDPQLPAAPTGSTGGASRRIQGELRLPPLPTPSDFRPTVETEQPGDERQREDIAPSTETQGTIFPSQGGGSFLPHHRSFLPHHRLMIFATYLKILIVNHLSYLHVNQLRNIKN